jgi:hypothetical protein
MVQPQYLDSIDFLRRFHPGRRWVLTSISTDKRSITTATFTDATANQCLEWLEAQGGTRNIYFSVGEVARDVSKKAERTEMARVWWLHVDIDPRAGEDIKSEQERALKLLKNPPNLPPPTCIVFSGGGYQGFWKLSEPIPIDCDLGKAEEAKRYNLQIEILLGADNVHNIDRIMRLPGTVNRPDELKLKKGRTPELARLEYWEPEHAYSIDEFMKAPEVQAAGGSGFSVASPTSVKKVQVSGNVRRLNSVDELKGVSDRGRVVIVQGIDPDEPNKFSGRSEWLFYACCEMVRAGIEDDIIFSVITDPQFSISASVLDKGSMTEKYALRQIERAKEEAVDPWLRKMNEQFAVIRNWSGKTRVVEEQFDESMGRYRLTKQTFDDFRNSWMHIKLEVGENKDGQKIMMALGQWWLNNEQRRQFDKIVFAPGKDVPNAYNLWRGFACEARPGGSCELFIKHLRDNIAQGNDVYFNYLVKWMARSVQRPDSPGYSAIVFRGGQGTGKSFVAKTLGSLFGRHFMQVTDPKHLVGSFNSHLRDCVLLFGDEAFYAGDKKHESVLKMLITEEMITIEAKGVDAEVSGNCIHLMMASNESWVVPAGMDDRRFFVLDIGDGAKNRGEYFQAIQDQLNAGGREALLHHLLTLDLNGFNVRDVPKTLALQQQKLFSMSPQDTWWYEKLRDGRVMAEHQEWREDVTVAELHEDYLSYCRQFNVARRGTAFAMRQQIASYMPGDLQKYQGNSPIECPMPDGTRRMVNRPYWYKLPTLDACRKHWDDKFGGPYDWPEMKIVDTASTQKPSPF